jgi:hypothetical protein
MTQTNRDLQIVNNRLDSFELQMTDYWTPSDFERNTELDRDYKKMVAEYKALYNAEPLYKACKYHDDVIELRNRLRKEV